MNFLKNPFKLITIIVAAALSGLLIWFLMRKPTDDFSVSNPGMDNRGKGVVVEQIINIGEHFKFFKKEKTDLTESWPRFRGADFDNIYKGERKLANKFTNGVGDTLWSMKLGEGHAGAIQPLWL